MMNLFAQAASMGIATLCLLAGCATRDKNFAEDSDPEMAAAIAQAQKTLPQFWEAFHQRARGESNFVLVARISDRGHIEHFHTTDFEQRDGRTFVTIGHAPRIVARVRLGDRVEIPAADLTDWSYMRDGKYVGLRTLRPRFKYMHPEDVEALKNVMVDP